MTARVALVTGGTGGIGSAICRKLADMGHKVATNYRNEEKTQAWLQEMRGKGYEFTAVKGDVSSPEEAEALIAKAQAQQVKEEATIQAILEDRWDLSFVDALEARCNN